MKVRYFATISTQSGKRLVVFDRLSNQEVVGTESSDWPAVRKLARQMQKAVQS